MASRSRTPKPLVATGAFVGKVTPAGEQWALRTATDRDKLAQAKRALERTKRQERMMTSIAVVVTRNPNMKVVVKANIPSSMTDGRIIYVKPDMSLGENITHVRKVCGVRDLITEFQLCPACARIDDVQRKLYHELGHVAQGSFDTLSDAERVKVIERAIAERGAGDGTRGAKLLRVIEQYEGTHGPANYILAANLVSKFLPMLVNCLEDARVNRAMYAARPGLQVMFRSEARRVFTEGIPEADGTRSFWGDADKDAQAMIGTSLLAAGYDELVTSLSTEVQAALADPALRVQLMKVGQAKSVEGVYSAAFPILEALRAHGFCRRADDTEDDPKPAPKPQPQGEQPECEGEGAPSGQSGSKPGESDTKDGEGEGEGQGAQAQADEGEGEAQREHEGEGAQAQDDEGEAQAQAQGAQDDEHEGEGAQAQDDEGEAQDDEHEGEGAQAQDDEHEGEGAQAQGNEHEGEGEGDDDDDYEGAEGIEPTDLEKLMAQFMGHHEDGRVYREGGEPDDEYLKAAEVQFEVFEDTSPEIYTLNVHRWDEHITTPSGADRSEILGWSPLRLVTQEHYEVAPISAGVINRSVARARLVFAENAAVETSKNQRSGLVDSGRLSLVRAGEKRVFMRNVSPDKRDYFAVVGMDISGSTAGRRIVLIKQLGGALAEVFTRTGIAFGLYGHTGYRHDFSDDRGNGGKSTEMNGNLDVDIFEIKGPTESWTKREQLRLANLTSAAQNLDGHTLEYYRKVAEASPAQEKIIFYLTDGAMPAANRDEELTILQREIAKCRQLGITLVALGLETDSPKQHGLDTIEFDSADDLPRVIGEIEKRITRR